MFLVNDKLKRDMGKAWAATGWLQPFEKKKCLYRFPPVGKHWNCRSHTHYLSASRLASLVHREQKPIIWDWLQYETRPQLLPSKHILGLFMQTILLLLSCTSRSFSRHDHDFVDLIYRTSWLSGRKICLGRQSDNKRFMLDWFPYAKKPTKNTRPARDLGQ